MAESDHAKNNQPSIFGNKGNIQIHQILDSPASKNEATSVHSSGSSTEVTNGNGVFQSVTTPEKPGINWDIFESSKQEKTSSSKDFWEKVNVVSKILMCVVLFISVLGTAVVSKICFVIITANIYPTNGNQSMDYIKTVNGKLKYPTDKTNVLWLWALILMAGTPHIFTAMETFWKVTFRSKGEPPGWRAIVIKLLLETINSIGLNMMIFIVIPKLDPLSGILMANSICLVPAFLKIFTWKSKSESESETKMKQVEIALGMIGTLGQISAIALWVYHIHNTINKVMYSPAYIICLTLAPILTSVQWWENFVYDPDTILGLTQTKEREGEHGQETITTETEESARKHGQETITTETEESVRQHGQETITTETETEEIARQHGQETITTETDENARQETITTETEESARQERIATETQERARQERITTETKESACLERITAEIKKSARQQRITLSFYASVWRIILLFVLPTSVYGLFCGYKQTACVDSLYFKENTTSLNTTIGHVSFETRSEFGATCSRYLPLVIAAVGALSSGICFKLGKIACKIMTQVIDYTLPLVLSTPATFGVILGMYSGSILTEYAGCAMPFPTLSDRQDQNVLSWFIDRKGHLTCLIPFLAGLCGYFSVILVTCHIWNPLKQRIQRTEELFVLPLYCGIFLDQSLMLNRRRETTSDGQKENASDADKPMIYLCATMWHETEQEMTQLLKSIFRIDRDQKERKDTATSDQNRFRFEAHIFLDDAFESCDNGTFIQNKYVERLIEAVQKSASEMSGVYKIEPHHAISLPYGERLEWKLPGGHSLYAHLKNEKLIRRRKRWSQVMYMCYILGFKMKSVWNKEKDNTFLLALDGDVDFKPKAVELMIDRMRKNKAVGAACGRIHPTGNGVIVWYQIFEYALSHWFQKSTEDKFGCVLCSPGCFSLYRASALAQVLKTYTTEPTEPKHCIQYDQGEDRWLCTLLLQQGHRIEYCAAADAFTHAPERFQELFNQRKRWIPSTMANILDLLSNWKHVTQDNPYISNSYMFYQSLLMVSSILTPGTTFLMILGAIHLAYPEIELWSALLINAIPVGLFIVLCFVAKPSTQITFAAILSSLYSLLMMIVIVALMRQAGAYGMCSIATLFIVFVAGIFVLAAILHPQEFLCILHGFVYFLAIPATSMLLMIYSLVNLHNISWGTRENKPGTHKAGQHNTDQGFCFSLFTRCCSMVEGLFTRRNDDDRDAINTTRHSRDLEESFENHEQPASGSQELHRTDEINKDNSLLSDNKSKRKVEKMTVEELVWTDIIEKHLEPLDADDNTESQIEEKKKEQEERKELRNKVCLSVVLINLLFIIIVFSLQQGVEKGRSLSIQLPCATTNDTGQSIEPISVTFTLMFGILLCVQFTCMLVHRMSTFVHILAATSIFGNKKTVPVNSNSQSDQKSSAKDNNTHVTNVKIEVPVNSNSQSDQTSSTKDNNTHETNTKTESINEASVKSNSQSDQQSSATDDNTHETKANEAASVKSNSQSDQQSSATDDNTHETKANEAASVKSNSQSDQKSSATDYNTHETKANEAASCCEWMRICKQYSHTPLPDSDDTNKGTAHHELQNIQRVSDA